MQLLSGQLFTGNVIDGKVALNSADLPDGTEVTLVANTAEHVIVLPPELEAELDDALDDAALHEGVSLEEALEMLKKIRES